MVEESGNDTATAVVAKYVPKSVEDFQPADEDIFLRVSKGRYQRILFSG